MGLRRPALGGLISFVFGIVDTMQNWRKEIQFSYPGDRDSIVQIRPLKDDVTTAGSVESRAPKPRASMRIAPRI